MLESQTGGGLAAEKMMPNKWQEKDSRILKLNGATLQHLPSVSVSGRKEGPQNHRPQAPGIGLRQTAARCDRMRPIGKRHSRPFRLAECKPTSQRVNHLGISEIGRGDIEVNRTLGFQVLIEDPGRRCKPVQIRHAGEALPRRIDDGKEAPKGNPEQFIHFCPLGCRDDLIKQLRPFPKFFPP